MLFCYAIHVQAFVFYLLFKSFNYFTYKATKKAPAKKESSSDDSSEDEEEKPKTKTPRKLIN